MQYSNGNISFGTCRSTCRKDERKVFAVREGYWRKSSCDSTKKFETAEESQLPFPVSTEDPLSEENKAFIKKLKIVEDGCDKIHRSDYMGISPCRICKEHNHSAEFSTVLDNNSDLVWPAGLAHYYEEHNVLPSRLFVEHIERIYKENEEDLLAFVNRRKKARAERAQKDAAHMLWYANLNTQERARFDEEQRQKSHTRRMPSAQYMLGLMGGIGGPLYTT